MNAPLYSLWLTMLFGAADPRIHKVIRKYGSAEYAYEQILSGDHSALEQEQISSLGYVTLTKAEAVLGYCGKAGISVVCLGDESYPSALREIFNPPLVLFCRGDLSCLSDPCITIVGARDATEYYLKLCRRISKDLSAAGFTLVSGLAKGIDSCVHNVCVNEQCPTAAVAACGLDYDYPFGSLDLRRKIVGSGGVCLSELLPKAEVSKTYFRVRNRVLAGLSLGTAVIQASDKSGSLITANYAVEEGRDVFCVPPCDITEPRFSGVIQLIRDGAIPLFNHDDIIGQYDYLKINQQK